MTLWDVQSTKYWDKMQVLLDEGWEPWTVAVIDDATTWYYVKRPAAKCGARHSGTAIYCDKKRGHSGKHSDLFDFYDGPTEWEDDAA